jgi:hypothetical protein
MTGSGDEALELLLDILMRFHRHACPVRRSQDQSQRVSGISLHHHEQLQEEKMAEHQREFQEDEQGRGINHQRRDTISTRR